MYIDANYLKSIIRTVPDWPEKGVLFRDITPLFQDARALRGTMDAFVQRYFGFGADIIAGMDARGFLIGVTLAYELNLPFVPIRKAGKLPSETISEEYALEYGTAAVEIHKDAIRPDMRVVIIDDLIATGGTMLAGIKLVERLGGRVIEASAIIDLPELKGSEKIKKAGYEVFTILSYAGH